MTMDLMIFALTTIFAVIGFFLRQKDEQQAAQIKLLFEKHDADAQALQELRVQIAAKHYERPELDAKFDKLEQAIKEGFGGMRSDFARLSEILIDHIRKEDGHK